jgi:hypothetical protein
VKKAKYNLSQEGMDTLMKKLAQVAQEGVSEEDGLQTSAISTHFVKVMTKVKDLEDVIERNEQLSKTYQGFLNLYGFDTMYDMYIYAKSCDLFPDELMKSTTSAIPVERVIVRNGKPLEVTVWELLAKSEPKSKAEPKKAEEAPVIRHARELKASYHDTKSAMNTEHVAKLKAAAEKMTGGSGKFKDNSHHYLSIKGDSGRPAAVIGYSEEGEHLKMDFYRTNGKVSGVAARGFFELIKLALRHKKGVIAADNAGARSVYIQAGLQKEGSKWVISYDDLAESYGESGMDSD